MFIYRNGRFSLGSASFALPDSCIVDTSLPLDSHNGLVIKPLDQSFKIYPDFDTKGNEPCCGLQRQAENWNGNVEVREEMLPCGIGWTATFAYEKKCYRELCIPLSEGVTDEDGNTLNELDVQVITATESESQAAVKHRVYTELVNSIVVKEKQTALRTAVNTSNQ